MTKEESQKYWPKGYFDPSGIGTRGNSISEIIAAAIEPHSKKAGVTVEVGTGGGTWTDELAKRSEAVVAVDVVPKSDYFKSYVKSTNVQYHVTNSSGSLWFIPVGGVSFIWSYDVFCHLPFSVSASYFAEFARVLENGGHVGIMFPCYERHSELKLRPFPARNTTNGMHWFYYSKEDVLELASSSGLEVVNLDIFPNNRDRLCLFKKV